MVQFAVNLSTMATHHRTEHTELHPTYIKFLIKRVLFCCIVKIALVVCICKETTDISLDVRISCKCIVQADRHLLTKGIPRSANIARPGVCTCALLTSEITACEYEWTTRRIRLYLYCIGAYRALHSFPTRRSADLGNC